MTYLAHKRTDTDQAEQLLVEHLINTAAICAKFAECINMSDYGEVIGKMHDFGKYATNFQKRLNGKNIKVDHSTAGAQEAYRRKMSMAAFCIAGHHGGIPDLGSKFDLSADPTLIGRMKKKIDDYSPWKQEIGEAEIHKIVENLKMDRLSYSFITRVLYSCLVDADFLDTENFMSGGTIIRNSGSDIDTLLDSLNQYISLWKHPQGKLNVLRTNMLNKCIQTGQTSNEKLFTLTVPTGGGKTISSLAFALNYAKKHNKKRIIYVIPYTSIIEQNAGVFRNILGDENVLENHSNVTFDDNLSEETKIQKMLACENWNSPVIVTTAVQFFESLFSNKPSKCRKIHNIAESVIIFDEAQMLPVDYLLPCVSAIQQLVENGNSAVVLCTATQPSLDKIFNMLDKNKTPINIQEICASPELMVNDFRRATFKYDGKLEDDELSARLKENDQFLCIVNKKSHAQKIYSLLGESEENFHLSTYMYPAHRKRVIDTIKNRLKENKPCRVVSTSLIEAGVDIDFPTVYRAVSGIDSILQAGGRCNRENRRSVSDSVVHIFDTDQVVSYQEINASVARDVIKKYGAQIYLPKAIELYFDSLYYYKDIDGSHNVFDRKGILKCLEKLEFATAAEEFRLIENNTKSVYIAVDENKSYITDLRSGQYSKELFRNLQQYVVDLYDYDFKKLDEMCAIEYIDDSFYVLSDTSFYNEKTGITLPSENNIKGIFL